MSLLWKYKLNSSYLFFKLVKACFSFTGFKVHYHHCSDSLYWIIFCIVLIEPPHDKTNKMSVRPAKTQIRVRRVWSESSLCAQWVVKDPSFLHADSEDSDQTGRMPRLIWVFVGRTATLVIFLMRRLRMFNVCHYHSLWMCWVQIKSLSLQLTGPSWIRSSPVKQGSKFMTIVFARRKIPEY